MIYNMIYNTPIVHLDLYLLLICSIHQSWKMPEKMASYGTIIIMSCFTSVLVLLTSRGIKKVFFLYLYH